MKLFGGKKGGKDFSEPEYDAVSDEILEGNEVEPSGSVRPYHGFDNITVDQVMDPVQANQPPQELKGEDGFIHEIAESIGISQEEIQQGESLVNQISAEEKASAPKKPTRAEKKEAKKAAKEAAKAEKKALKKAKKEAKKWSLGKKLLATFVLLLAVAITVFAGYFVSQMWVTPSSLDVYDADFVGDIQKNDGVIGLDGSEEEEEQGAATPVDSTRKKGCYTFLVAARDVASGCTDVIIVGRFDTENKTINMVSIPRDTMINKGNLKVNTAYQGDLASGGNGIDGLMKEMKKILGFEIDSYAIVDVDAVAKLIDAIGGVYFDVPMDMKYTDGSQGLAINIKKGYQKLSGEDAVKVLRFRKGYANGDLGRINVQHDFIKALAEQVLDVGNIPNLGAAIDIYQEHVQSNLTAGNILFYAKHFLKMDTDNIQFVDMPQMMGGMVNNQSFIFINPTKWVTVINEYLNPYKADITQGNLSIKTSADQGQSFYYTGGAR